MKNILLVLISFVIIGCSIAESPITNTVELTSVDFKNARDFKEAKACEIYFLYFIGPFFGDAQIIKAIQENYIKKVYAVDEYFTNYFIFYQERCIVVFGEEMTPLEKKERKKKDKRIKEKNERIKEKMDAFWDKKKPWYSDFLFWEN